MRPEHPEGSAVEQGHAHGSKAAAAIKTRLVNPNEASDRRPIARPSHVQSAIDSKLRGRDVVAVRVDDVTAGGHTADRATVRQNKTGRPVRFELPHQLKLRGPSSQSLICAEDIVRFGRCGLRVPAATSNPSDTRCLANFFASASFKNELVFREARDPVAGTLNDTYHVCFGFLATVKPFGSESYRFG